MSAQHTKLATTNLFVMSSLGAVSGAAKDINNGKDLNLNPDKLLFDAFDKGGAFAYIDMLSSGLDAYGIGVGSMLNQTTARRRQAAGIVETLGGVNFRIYNKNLPEGLGAIKRMVTGEDKAGDAKKIARIAPLNNYIAYNWALKPYLDN